MQIFLTTVNPGSYTFFDLGGYNVTHPIGPIPLIEPLGEFTLEDIQISEDLISEVAAGNITLSNEGGNSITTITELQTADPGIFVKNVGDENIAGIKSFTTGLNVNGTVDYELTINNDDDIPNKKYIDDLLVASDLSILRLHRLTSLNPIPTSWVDFEWDTKYEENNTGIVEYTGAPSDEIQIKEAGVYLISWAISCEDGSAIRLLNNGIVVDGSLHSTGDKTHANQIIAGNEKTIAVSLNVGTLVLQIEAQSTAQFTIANNASINIVRLSGPAGPPGSIGPIGFGIYAWGTTNPNGVLLDGLGISVVTAGTGLYNYTFDIPTANNNYAVIAQSIGANQQDVESEVFNKTNTGFSIRTNTQDDGGGTGTNIFYDHSVIIIGPNNGSPSGAANTINVLPTITNNPVSNINFNIADFNISNGIVDTADVSIIDKNVYSIMRVISTGADQATNYNSTTLQPLILTGNTTTFGSGAIDFTNNNGTITCNFDGDIKVKYAVPHFSTGARGSLKTTIQINNVDYSSASYGYIRDSQGHRRDDNTGYDVAQVVNGDTVRIGMLKAEGSTAAAALTIELNTIIIIERTA